MVTGEGESGTCIRAFREELQKSALVDFFMTAEELANLVSQAVANWQSNHGNKDPSHLYDYDRLTYLEQVSTRYGSVKLPVGPADGLSLHAIFQPLTLCKDPLAAEDIEHRKRHGWNEEDYWLRGEFDSREMLLLRRLIRRPSLLRMERMHSRKALTGVSLSLVGRAVAKRPPSSTSLPTGQRRRWLIQRLPCRLTSRCPT